MAMDSNLKSNLTCSICLDLYNDPVALYCMHSFCRDCLIENLNSRAPPRTTDETKVRVPCPNCKREVPLSRNGVRGMQRNFQLQSIVDSYRRNNPERPTPLKRRGPPCDMCKDSDGRLATKRCMKCEVSYCTDCLKVYHPARGPYATHSITDIGSGGGATGGKPTIPPRPRGGLSAEPIKAQLRKDFEDLTSEVDRVKAFVDNLKRVKSAVEKKTVDLKDGITNESRKLRDFITKTETEHRGAVIEESKQKLMMVEIQLREHQDYLRKQEDLMDSVRALLKEPDETAFLKTAPSVKEKVQSSKQSKPRLDAIPRDTDLRQSVEKFQAFKQQIQGLMQGGSSRPTIGHMESASVPPSPPPISSDLCVCQTDSIAICIALPVGGSEASKIDTYGYKYKKTNESEWRQGTVPVSQIESRGCVKIGSLTPSTQYNISIRAHNPFGWSPWSSTELLKTLDVVKPPTQGAPVTAAKVGVPRVDVTKTHVGSEIIILQWTPGTASDAHVVAYCSADVGSEDWTYALTQDSSNTFTISGLSPGSAYLLKVSGCSKDGFSDWSKKVKIRLGEQKLPDQQSNVPQPRRQMAQPAQVEETSFGLDKQTAHPCLIITGKNIVHPSNACPSLSDYFSDNCYSVFGNASYSSGVHYWEVIIHGQGSKVRVGIAEPNVNMYKPLGTCPDAWVLVMDARSPSERQGSFVLYGNHMHKSGGKWIPFTNYIGIQLDYNQKEICFIQYEGPPSATTKRTSHGFQFHPPAQVKPVFAVDDKTDDLRLQVITDKKPPGLPASQQDDPIQEMLAFLARKEP